MKLSPHSSLFTLSKRFLLTLAAATAAVALAAGGASASDATSAPAAAVAASDAAVVAEKGRKPRKDKPAKPAAAPGKDAAPAKKCCGICGKNAAGSGTGDAKQCPKQQAADAQKKSGEQKPAAGAAPQQASAAPQQPPAPKPDPEDPLLKAMQKEIARLTLEKNLIDARLAFEDARRRDAAARRSAERNAAAAEEKSRIETDLALEALRDNAKLAKRAQRLRELEAEMRTLKAEVETANLRHLSTVDAFKKRQELARVATNARPKHLKEPLVNGTLYISDRRIPFNGVVTQRLAERVIERINFLNNQSATDPIFIVIDRSPGGSVAAGFQILKAMESSKAPVYVVVKGYAASMAAVITTLAQRSFCYDNTIILHHQMSTMLGGNMSSLKDQMKTADKWYRRLATPVAKKMGKTLEEFTKEMYKHNADADWEEFGSEAKKLKWVDNVVERIVETGIVEEKPDTPPAAVIRLGHVFEDGCVGAEDDMGRRCYRLPVLENPFDCWWIYDRRGLYRTE